MTELMAEATDTSEQKFGATMQAMAVQPQLQQMLAIAPQFAGHAGGRCRLGDAAEDEQELRRRASRTAQRGGGEGVEDPAALAALPGALGVLPDSAGPADWLASFAASLAAGGTLVASGSCASARRRCCPRSAA